jgi:hypothetical protein
MGKASERRRRNRAHYLQRLAKADPVDFRREWTKRLSSWADEAHQSAGRLRDRNGRYLKSAAEVVERAMQELERVGDVAVALEGSYTREVLTHEASRAVAAAVDGRLYRLGNGSRLEETIHLFARPAERK